MTHSGWEQEEDTNRLLACAAAGDTQAWGALLSRYRQRLRRLVALRLDRRLQARLDPSDVIQEAFLEASLRLLQYLQSPCMPFFLWLRFLTGQKLLFLHRLHLGAEMRDVTRELSLSENEGAGELRGNLAAQLRPRCAAKRAAVRAEVRTRLYQALDRMLPLDRRVLTLRHFEHLNNAETAKRLGLNESAASKRYVRAIQRLREVLTSMADDWETGP